MRAWISMALVLGLAGCNLRQQVAGGGLGLMVGGLMLTYSGEERAEATTVQNVGIGMILVGLATMFTAAALEEAAS
ncbi:MAG: hypothetical protein M3680_26200, partial [Myxococcota bacterium]|nr:hypothetical protein [Myxococcota bacterium]